MKYLTTSSLLLFSLVSFAQLTNWYDQDIDAQGYFTVSTNKAYKELLNTRTPNEIVVAVIDSGVDAEHEDLKDVMWINQGEIPGNKIDDDNNGYIDDINGWNFIGNANGKNVVKDNLEMTRLFAEYRKLFDGRTSVVGLPRDQVEKYQQYIEWKKLIDKAQEGSKGQLMELKQTKTFLLEIMDSVRAFVQSDSISEKDLDLLTISSDQILAIGANVLNNIKIEYGSIPTVSELKSDITYQYDMMIDQKGLKSNYHFNPDLDTRSIVGDNYDDINERYYGNNDVEGPDAMHGTHVAGLIAATRDNDLGLNGIANNVKIMSIRAVPDGDERDKDVANAIRYAVDNGAKVINMSFGKGYSPQKEAVDRAVKYAEKHDVLMIHASGNDNANNDVKPNFPNDTYKKGFGFLFFKKKSPSNWLEVGAIANNKGELLVTSFSNYGKREVDVFAPGLFMLSTFPDNDYGILQGTSMAAPIVSGIAGVLRGYFPDLKAKEIKSVIMDSSLKTDQIVVVPGGEGVKKPFSELSVSGGSVNLYTAFQRANSLSKYGGKYKSQSTSRSKGVNSNAKNKTIEAE